MSRAGSTGGDNRARHILDALAERTGARSLAAHGRRGVPRLAAAVAAESGGWRRPVQVASAELLAEGALRLVRGPVEAAVLDVHDHPVLQTDSLGVHLDSSTRTRLDRLFDRNIAAFSRLVAPSASFAELCALDADRVVVITNGTDTAAITQHPPVAAPVVGMASGAAPGRGIEQLVAAMARVRAEIPEATLRLALAASGPASRAYLDDLRADLTDPWVTVTEVPHAGLDAFLAETAVLVVPHPPGAYMDAAAPVKVFDAMASGRPLVVTPRFETRRIVEEAGAGAVAAGDEVDDLAAAIWELLRDESRRRSQGDNARRTAVERYDWRILSAQLADAVLGPQNASR